MTAYTDTELTAAVEQFVRAETTTRRDPLGPLDTSHAFTEVVAFASSTFVNDPGAVFYLLSLAANKLNQSVLTLRQYVQTVQDAIEDLGRYQKKVTRTSLLEDAASALLDVESILSRKDTLATGPLARYNQALDKFVRTSLQDNIRKLDTSCSHGQYALAMSPAEAQQQLSVTLPLLKTLHAQILTQAQYLAEGLAIFVALDLTKYAAQEAVQKIRKDLRALKAQLDGLSEQDAIAQARTAYLNITSGRSVLNTLSAFNDPRQPLIEGTASNTFRAQAGYLAGTTTGVPAQVTLALTPPYYIIPGVEDEVVLAVDSGSTQVATLVPADSASLTGSVDETYTIGAGTDSLSFTVDLTTQVTVSLTHGTRTAAQIAADIAAASPLLDAAAITITTPLSDTVTVVQVSSTSYGEYSALEVTPQTADDLATMALLGFTNQQFSRSRFMDAKTLKTQLLAQLSGITCQIEPLRFESGTSAQLSYSGTYEITIDVDEVDGTIEPNDVLVLLDGKNAGHYRVASAVLAGASWVAIVTLPFRSLAAADTTGLTWELRRDQVTLYSATDALASQLDIGSSAQDANTTLGLTAGGQSVGQVNGLTISEDGMLRSVLSYSVEAGDTVMLTGGLSDYERTVTAIADDGYHVVLSSAIPNTVNDVYFRFDYAGLDAYEMFQDAIDDWLQTAEQSVYSELRELERALNPLLATKNPTKDLLNAAAVALGQVETLYDQTMGLGAVLEQFVVTPDDAVDALMDMLIERGLDRARDLLLAGRFDSFFALSQHEASYRGNLLERSRQVARDDLPEPTDDEALLDWQFEQSFDDIDAELDFSDADDEEDLLQTDDIPTEFEEDLFLGET